MLEKMLKDMTPEEMEESLEKLSITELRIRLDLATKIIKEAQAKQDERWRKVVPQQRAINKVLVKKIKDRRNAVGDPDPEPVKIGMKPVILTAKRVRRSAIQF